MKLLSIVIPCYNSEAYMRNAIESLLPGGDQVEILIVNDGSQDDTAQIADEYEHRYPGIVRAIHQQNAGHGGAVMAGLRNASGLYFKVVDSDDKVDVNAYKRVLETLEKTETDPIDMLISNYVYDKIGKKHKHVVRYRHVLPVGRVFGWNETRCFHKGQYLLMHAVIYRTQLLKDCGLELPLHTFYVDILYVYEPLKNVEKMIYLDVDFYRYFIGRDDQSVQEQIMMRRIDQYLLINKLMLRQVDPFSVFNQHKRKYMLSFLEIITTVSSVLLTKNGTEEDLLKKRELWDYIQKKNPLVYHALRRRLMGRLVHLPGKVGRAVLIIGYNISRFFFGFN